MTKVIEVPREYVNEVWPIVRGWLIESLKYGLPWFTIADLLILCLKGDFVIWLINLDEKPCGVILSELITYPSAKVCNAPWIGGERLNEWLPEAQKRVETWGKRAGATYLMGGGRKGWIRAAGMKEMGVILTKEI